jgi:sodium-dependent dicarboxylate transporter 2/3/5
VRLGSSHVSTGDVVPHTVDTATRASEVATSNHRRVASSRRWSARAVGTIVGPLLCVGVVLLPIDSLAADGQLVLGLAAWMAAWWFTEAIPTAATALLPLVVFPLLNRSELDGFEQSYADNTILLILGTLLVARAISRSGIDQRVALHLLRTFSGSSRRIVAGFMIACALIAAWITSTATTVIMLPVALSVISTVDDDEQRRRFGRCLVLAVVYGSTLGVVSTIIATPPNAVFASLAPEVLGFTVGFGQWMLVGVPIAAVSVALAWLYLVHFVAPVGDVALNGREVVQRGLAEHGPLSRDEKLVGIVFLTLVAAWVSRSLLWSDVLPKLNNTTIVMTAALALFLLPSSDGGRLLDWTTAVELPWSVLLLIGGGLALAHGFTALGVDVWIAESLGFLENLPVVLAVAVMATVAIVVSEVVSNTATAALLIPIAAPLAEQLDLDPVQLTLVVTLGATFGFTLPVASPANAVALDTGMLSTSQLAKAGVPMNVLGVIVVTIASFTLVPLVFG